MNVYFEYILLLLQTGSPYTILELILNTRQRETSGTEKE